MIFPDPSADSRVAHGLLNRIRGLAREIGRTVRLMEVCGTHTMTIHRAGLPGLLPENVRLLSGPGCPVCVTPMGYVDAAVALAQRSDTIVTTFGDMMRVPGSAMSLEQARAQGAGVQMVYSPSDALTLARQRPQQTVVFLAVGFETTAPATAVTLDEAQRTGVKNFHVLAAHKVVPPALRVLLDDPETAIDGFILPGHVSVVLGLAPYEFIARDFSRSGVVTGFEPNDVLQSIAMLLGHIASEKAVIENQYGRVVRPEGNRAALTRMEKAFDLCDAEWRGLGSLPASGLKLKSAYGAHDAETTLGVVIAKGKEPAGCRCGEVLRGIAAPEQCGLFATRCTPMTPVGACMVSSEGTCAAHFKYRSPQRETP